MTDKNVFFFSSQGAEARPFPADPRGLKPRVEIRDSWVKSLCPPPGSLFSDSLCARFAAVLLCLGRQRTESFLTSPPSRICLYCPCHKVSVGAALSSSLLEWPFLPHWASSQQTTPERAVAFVGRARGGGASPVRKQLETTPEYISRHLGLGQPE